MFSEHQDISFSTRNQYFLYETLDMKKIFFKGNIFPKRFLKEIMHCHSIIIYYARFLEICHNLDFLNVRKILQNASL